MSTDTTGVPGGRTHMWMAEAYGGRHCVLLFAACPVPASTTFLTHAHTEQTHMPPPLNCHCHLYSTAIVICPLIHPWHYRIQSRKQHPWALPWSWRPHWRQTRGARPAGFCQRCCAVLYSNGRSSSSSSCCRYLSHLFAAVSLPSSSSSSLVATMQGTPIWQQLVRRTMAAPDHAAQTLGTCAASPRLRRWSLIRCTVASKQKQQHHTLSVFVAPSLLSTACRVLQAPARCPICPHLHAARTCFAATAARGVQQRLSMTLGRSICTMKMMSRGTRRQMLL